LTVPDLTLPDGRIIKGFSMTLSKGRIRDILDRLKD